LKRCAPQRADEAIVVERDRTDAGSADFAEESVDPDGCDPHPADAVTAAECAMELIEGWPAPCDESESFESPRPE
jgi:hypothetical protein